MNEAKNWTRDVLDYVGFGTMQLRFTIFYKIVSLRSVFAPVEFSSKTLTSPINCYKQIQNWAVLALFYARMQRLFYRLGNLPSFYSGIFPTAVINYFALYSEAGSLPRLKLRTAYAFFLTIRQSQLSALLVGEMTIEPYKGGCPLG